MITPLIVLHYEDNHMEARGKENKKRIRKAEEKIRERKRDPKNSANYKPASSSSITVATCIANREKLNRSERLKCL